jgi:hypothetical protein
MSRVNHSQACSMAMVACWALAALLLIHEQEHLLQRLGVSSQLRFPGGVETQWRRAARLSTTETAPAKPGWLCILVRIYL